MRRLQVLRSPCALRRRHVAPLPPRLPHSGAMPTPIQTRQIQWKKADPVKRLDPWKAALHYGQPVHETHPHILDSGHLTPGIPATEYHHRRNQLILDIPDGAVAVLPSADIKYASGAVFYPFRQESNFWYLTGWEEPESVAVIERRGRDYLFTLFCREKNSESEQWGGPWSGCQAAQDVFNADAAYPITTVDNRLQQILKTATYIYTDVDASNSSPHKLAATLRGASCPIRPLSPILNQHRAVKSQAERAVMRKAAEISSEGFNTAMSIQWSTESDIANILNLQFCQRGGSGHAYVPVVAAGHRGVFIHWTQNNRLIFPEDLITVDAGASFGGYSADITRTWPNSGKFTPAQKDLYQVVLSVQRAAVSSCHEDSGLNLDALHLKVQAELREGLRDLGFDVSRYDAMRILFPHHVGHHVGIDVHDMPGYPKNAPFKHGNCITVEPGIYVPNDERWPVHFRGMGIRVEDYVCVGRGAGTVYNFSSNAVKEVDDIEHLPRKQLGHPLLYVTEPNTEDALSSTKPAP